MLLAPARREDAAPSLQVLCWSEKLVMGVPLSGGIPVFSLSLARAGFVTASCKQSAGSARR